MKRKNNNQELKNLEKSILKNRFIMLIPLVLCVVFIFLNAISYVGTYGIKVETKDSKAEYILEFDEEATQGVSLLDIILGNNRETEIVGTLTVNQNTAKATEETVLIICPTVPGLLVFGILFILGLILSVVPIFKCSKANMIQLCVSVLLIVVSVVFMMAKLNELLPEYAEISRLSVLQQIVGNIDHKDISNGVSTVVSYQFILLAISAAVQVFFAVVNLFNYRRKARLQK